RREAILKTIERRDACKKRAAQIVEEMLETPLSEDWTLSVLHDLSQQDYQDAVEERAIVLLCGYPLCNIKIAQMPKQKYHICMKSKKVYDITHRKQFCSDTCYRASMFLKAQLWDGPLWLRDEADSLGKYTLYQDQRHQPQSDGRGDEIDLGHRRITKKEVVEDAQVEKPQPKELLKPTKVVTPYVSADALRKMAQDIDSMSLGKSADSADVIERREQKVQSSSPEHHIEDKPSTPACEQPGVISMAPKRSIVKTPASSHKSWLSMLESEKRKTSRPASQPEGNVPSVEEHAEHILRQWVTGDTVEMLVGKEAAKDFRQRHQTCDEIARAERFREMYAKLCRKLDEEEKLEEQWEKSLLDSDDDEDEDGGGARTRQPTAPMPTIEELAADPIVERLEIHERYENELTSGTAEAVKSEDGQVPAKKATKKNQRKKPTVPKSNADPSPAENDTFLPLIDTHAQNVHRRRIVLDRLKKLLPDILDLLYLDLSEISPDLTEMVLTFRLAADNVTFKLEIWTYIAGCLLMMLSRRCPPLAFAVESEEPRRKFSLFLEEMGTSMDAVMALADKMLMP
ncbi:unnamed protein product, partial [Ixodes hexagonus]